MKEPIYKDKYTMALDYGEKRIGIAFGLNDLVTPVKTIKDKDENTAIKEITTLYYENKIKTLVLGLPLTIDGKETNFTKKVRRFAKVLRVYLKIPIVFVNEYGTSQEALIEAIEFDVPMKKRHAVDQYSAALILKRYFNEN